MKYNYEEQCIFWPQIPLWDDFAHDSPFTEAKPGECVFNIGKNGKDLSSPHEPWIVKWYADVSMADNCDFKDESLRKGTSQRTALTSLHCVDRVIQSIQKLDNKRFVYWWCSCRKTKLTFLRIVKQQRNRWMWMLKSHPLPSRWSPFASLWHSLDSINDQVAGCRVEGELLAFSKELLYEDNKKLTLFSKTFKILPRHLSNLSDFIAR